MRAFAQEQREFAIKVIAPPRHVCPEGGDLIHGRLGITVGALRYDRIRFPGNAGIVDGGGVGLSASDRRCEPIE